MLPTSSIRQLLAGRTLHIVALAVAGLLAPLGACVSGGGGDGADGQQCPWMDEYTNIGVTLYDGEHYDCSYEASLTLEGVVRSIASNAFVVDSCHPNANCAQMETVIQLSGTDLSVSIPDGTFVQVGLYSRPPKIGCLLHVVVRNVPVWGGTPNPTSDRTFLWLAYHKGFDGPYALPDDPYQTERELACQGKFFETPSVYTWRFSFPDAPGAEVVAPQGQTVTWSVPAGEHAGQYRVRNVEATRDTHDEDNYWIARK